MEVGALLQLINFAAALNGAVIGLVILVQERLGPTSARLELGGFVLGISVLLGFFVLMDMGIVAPAKPLIIGLNTMGIAAAGLFFNYVRGAVGLRFLPALAFVPAIFYAVAALAVRGPLPPHLDITGIVLLHIAFTVGATIAYLAGQHRLPANWRDRRENRHLPLLLIGMYILHIAQIARILFPENAVLFDLVPLTGAVGLMAFTVYSVIGSPALRAMVAMSPPPAGPNPPGAQALAHLRSARLFLDPDISLAKLAGEVGMSPRGLSSTLNAELGKPFRELVNDLRVDEARRLLTSPAEATTSIEAIALLAGFRSRSSFYEAFKARTGLTPSEYRAKPD